MDISKRISDRLQLTKSFIRKTGKMAITLRQKTPPTAFISQKSQQDFLTLADTTVQQCWHDAIAAHYPNDVILAEENSTECCAMSTFDIQKTEQGLWVLDPIDGTANFMRGMSEWAISIAYIYDAEIQFSAIYLPEIKRLLWAVKGQGAFCQPKNKHPHRIYVSNEAKKNRSTFILSRSQRWDIDSHLASVANLEKESIAYRLFGSASYSLACVAQGQAEGFFEPHMHPWDITAGLLLVQEAGGKTNTAPLAHILQHGGNLLACNGKIDFSQMVL